MFLFNQQNQGSKEDKISSGATHLDNKSDSKIDYKNWQAEVYHRIAEMCWSWPKSILDTIMSKLSKEEQLQLAKAVIEKGHDCVYNAVNQGDSFFKMIADNPHLYPQEYSYLTQACIVDSDLGWCKYFRGGIHNHEEL